MIRSKYDETETKAIKKVRRNIFDLSNNFEYFEAFWTLEQNVVFHYKKWSKTPRDFGPHLPPVPALVGAFRNTLDLFPNKFLSHLELRDTKNMQKLSRVDLRNALDLSSLNTFIAKIREI